MNIENDSNEKKIDNLEVYNLAHFIQNQFLSDTIIINKIDQKEYFAHKIVLSAGSKFFFNSYLSNDTDQKLELRDNKVVVEIPDKVEPKIYKVDDNSTIPIILKYLYNNQEIQSIKPELNFNNSFSLLSLSQAWGITSLHKSLGEYIISDLLKEENCAKIYYESLVYDQCFLQSKALSIILKNFYKISKSIEEFKAILDLPYDLVKVILSNDDLTVENEKEVCDIVINYIKLRRNLNEDKITEVKKEEEEKKEKSEEEKKDESSEEKKDIPQDEIKNEETTEKIPDKFPEKFFSSSDTNYNDIWKNKLENIKEKFTIKFLKTEEERVLIECIRFSYLTHSELLSLSIDPIIQNHKDLILEGMSLRLKNYETVEKKDFKVNLSSRNYLSQEPIRKNTGENLKNAQTEEKNKEKVDDSKTLVNPLSSIEEIKVKSSKLTGDIVNNSKINPNLRLSNNYPNQFINSMPGNFNPRPPQSLMFDTNLKAINFSQTLSNNSAIELNYEYDFDENGVFYYLGTMSKITNWRNPNDIGQIKVFCSSLGKGRLSDFVGRDQVNLRTMNEPQSYFGVDFGEERTIIPTAYSIKNRNSSSHVLLCWQLEGSNDRINFEALDTRLFIHSDPKIHLQLEKERNILKSPGCSSTWAVDTSVKNKYPNGFRYLVLRQIGKNSSGAFNMGLSGFEVYGKCIGKRWIFK